MKSIIAFSIAFVVLIGASIGFYMWYFDDNSKTYVYDYKQNNSYQNHTSTNNQHNQEQNNISSNTYEELNINQESEPIDQNKSSVDENIITKNTQNSDSTSQIDTIDNQKIKNIKKEIATPINPTEQIKNTQINQVKNKEQAKEEKTTKYKNTMQEYIAKGKTSRYEPRLSDDFVKVYVLDGKNLSDYRISMLKEMINPIQANSQDYNLTIFINMLSNNNMKLSIYNKDIVFAKNKKKYNYVDIKISDLKFLFERNGYNKYSNENLLEKISQNLAREDVIKRMKIQGYADDRGSIFANYIIGLNRAMNVAKHFFSFTEIIEIESLGKDTYPIKDKSDSQRQNNRKVEISFYN
ncbi:hypothetical protein [Campylobacter armoricus]|uniref:OmpA domain-containing protein n=1 Tax=Campylobacter armoricus TaxID=2505970 RepID=A0A7L5HR31_9BACT|nr:hypothetical protein [Campylobacter armoricus]QKF79624.1 OmpA domain-containing protein [Campylobacter armoricus]